jgi:hypothetical protein
LSDDVGCTEGHGKETGSDPELVTDEVASITPDMAKGDDGNVDFAEAHGETACIEADSAKDDGNIEFTEAHDEATFTTPGLATGDDNVDFTQTEDEALAFAALGVVMGDGDVHTREAEGEETFTMPDLITCESVCVQHS